MMGTGTGAIAPAAAMLALLAATPCLAEAEAGAETMQALPGPAYEAARAAFEALPEADRISIQDALVWTGDYASTADGDFGRRTFEAILAWQQRAKRPASGILDRPSLAALAGAAGRAKAAAGFAVVTDPASGVRIGIPQKLLPKRSPNTIGGTRYQSADERVTLDTRSQPGGPDELRGLYERNIAIPLPPRRPAELAAAASDAAPAKTASAEPAALRPSPAPERRGEMRPPPRPAVAGIGADDRTALKSLFQTAATPLGTGPQGAGKTRKRPGSAPPAAEAKPRAFSSTALDAPPTGSFSGPAVAPRPPAARR